MTGRNKKNNEIAKTNKYNISKAFSEEVDKVYRKNGKIVRLSLEDLEGENSNWQIAARAMLRESSNRMNIKGMSILVSVAGTFSPTPKQKSALLAIAKQHCPNVYGNIRMEE